MNAPTPSPEAEDLLQRHSELLEELFALVREESRALSGGGAVDTAEHNDRKRRILEKMSSQVAAMRDISPPATQSRTAQKQVAALKARVLQILELQSENEKLLLKQSLPSARSGAGFATIPAGLLQRIYQCGTSNGGNRTT